MIHTYCKLYFLFLGKNFQIAKFLSFLLFIKKSKISSFGMKKQKEY